MYCFLASSFSLEYFLESKESSPTRYPVPSRTNGFTCFYKSEGVYLESERKRVTESWLIVSSGKTFDSSTPEYLFWFPIKKLVYNCKEHFLYCIMKVRITQPLHYLIFITQYQILF